MLILRKESQPVYGKPMRKQVATCSTFIHNQSPDNQVIPTPLADKDFLNNRGNHPDKDRD